MATAATPSTTTPNIVVILADDLGFSDLGCYGGEIPTPNLDRLAASGVRSSSFYTTPRCSPTRASLLTGRYSHEVGIGVLTRPVGYRGSIDPDVPTIATMLSDAGYKTCLAGKWHLAADVRQPSPSWPTRRGFEEFFGILGGGTSYFNPHAFFSGEEPLSVDADEEFYLTTALTRRAVRFISDAHAEHRPFFLHLAYTAPHWPLQAPADDVDGQRGRYAAGWDHAREARLARQEALGIFPAAFDAAPRDADESPWSDVEDAEWQQRRMEVYAAQVVALDRGVGEVLDQLDTLGVRDDTLILFLSDNGAEAEELAVGRFLSPHVTPAETRDARPVRIGNASHIEPGPEDTFTSYGRPWANLSNTPFRLYKKWVHEGGIAAPLIVSWPAGGIAAGEIVHSPQHVVDVLPTIAEATGAAVPPSLAGHSLIAELRGHSEPAVAERALFWEHIGHAAVRRDSHKLVRVRGGEWELYDLSVDRAEQHDLAGESPELVGELVAEWQEWAGSHGVIPWQDLVEEFTARGLPAWQAGS
jgi:arylsulfatase A-like enzyme